MKCLIVDDENIARKLLSDYVQKVPELQLVASCGSALQALNFINNNAIDILFLDIQMPDLTGLDFLATIPKKPATILTTAYSEYAVRSYELDIVDYLLKPIDFERFYKAVTKVMSIENNAQTTNLQNSTPSKKIDKLFIKADGKIIKISFNDILIINAQGPYVEFITMNGQKVLSLQSMSKLDEILPSNFYRTHRSHIVNTDYIDSIEGNQINLQEYKAVLSKNKREEFLHVIDKLNFLGE